MKTDFPKMYNCLNTIVSFISNEFISIVLTLMKKKDIEMYETFEEWEQKFNASLHNAKKEMDFLRENGLPHSNRKYYEELTNGIALIRNIYAKKETVEMYINAFKGHDPKMIFDRSADIANFNRVVDKYNPQYNINPKLLTVSFFSEYLKLLNTMLDRFQKAGNVKEKEFNIYSSIIQGTYSNQLRKYEVVKSKKINVKEPEPTLISRVKPQHFEHFKNICKALVVKENDVVSYSKDDDRYTWNSEKRGNILKLVAFSEALKKNGIVLPFDSGSHRSRAYKEYFNFSKGSKKQFEDKEIHKSSKHMVVYDKIISAILNGAKFKQ